MKSISEIIKTSTLLDNPLVSFRSKKTRQVIVLYGSSILGILLGIAVSVQNARLLGPKAFGDYQYILNLFHFAVTFATFGIFSTGGRMITLNENQDIKQNLVGSLLFLSIFLSILLSIGIVIYSFVEDRYLNNHIGLTLRIFSPLLFVFLLQQCLTAIMTADNRINELSFLGISYKLLFLVLAFAYSSFYAYGSSEAVGLFLFSMAIVTLLLSKRLNPSFRDLKKYIKLLVHDNKKTGFPVYIGALFGVASGQLAAFALSYYSEDNTNVGYFSLAGTTAGPLGMIPVIIATTFYKDFANRDRLPSKATKYTILLSIFSLVCYFILIKYLITLLYSSDYLNAVPLTYFVSIGAIVHGFGDYLNYFIFTHGMGKPIRNGAIIVGVVNILGYFLLVRFFSIMGAAYTKLFADLIYFLIMLYFYNKLIKKTTIEHASNI